MTQPHIPVDEIFFETLRCVSVAESAAYLDRVCADDLLLRGRIEQLVQAYPEAKEFLETPAGAGVTSLHEFVAECPGTQIGLYTLVREIGQGGMGIVYLAEQLDPVQRLVAVKIIKPGMDTQQVIARFTAERQILTVLDHPNIARVLDAGITDNGRPYFVMEWIDGLPITRHCDDHRCSVEQRLRLFVQVCHAVQQAHQKGIIHRDIKPSNVLVAQSDDRQIPKVIDFGIAKAIGPDAMGKTPFTELGQLIGTPEYMSPEQATLNPLDVETRSDVYSLGVLLYELVSGTTPFDRERLRTIAFDEMLRLIRHEEPLKPSKRLCTLQNLGSVANSRRTDATKLYKLVRGELDWIVMKALEKDCDRRYTSASDLAADIDRYLQDDPVLACPPSIGYRTKKFVRRNRMTVSAALITATALIGGTGVATWQAMRARNAQAQTEIAKQQLDDRYRIAKEAVDTYLLRVTQDERLDHPSFRQLRQSLLESALPYYDQLHKISPTDERSKAARAETLNQLGGVKHELGRFAESLSAFEESATLFDQLAADHSAQFIYRQSLAKVLVNLADHYRTRGANSESLDYEQSALALRQQLVAEHPASDLLQLELAQSYTNVGVGTQESHGRDLLERAIEIWQDLVDRFPDQPLYREYLSFGYQNLAHRFAWDHAEEAIPFHEFAIDLRAQLAIEQPESKKAHIQWAQSHQYLADTLEKLSPRLAEARQHCEDSIRILQAYSKKYPQWPEVKSHLATSLNKLAHTLKELGELESAHETCESSLHLWEQLLSEYPDMLAYEVGLAATQHNAGSIVVAQGQATEGMSMIIQSRDRLLKILDRIGPHDRSNELLRTITSSLADTRKALGQDRDRSSDDEISDGKTQTVGEALRPSKFLTDLSNSPTQSLRVGGMAPSLTQTEEQDQSMKRLRNQMSRSASSWTIRNNRPLAIEPLEGRQLLASLISVSDATINEVGSPSAFVTAGSGGLNSPRDLTLGPDGNVYVASNGTNSIIRYNSTTGQLIGTFVASGSGGLSGPSGLSFGPDNHLYVASQNSDSIHRYDGTTGASLGTFVPVASGGMDAPGGLTFGVDGNLYVSSADSDAVLRYQGPLGSSPGSPLPAVGKSGASFVSAGSGGLNMPVGIVFGPDGHLYVAAGIPGVVLRFDGTTGAFIDPFVPAEDSLDNPRGMVFDADGRLYVADVDANVVRRYDSLGNHLDNPVSIGSGSGLARAFGLAFDPTGNLLIGSLLSNAVLRYSSGPLVMLSQASASTVSVSYATGAGTAASNSDFTSQAGTINFSPGQTTRRILLATRDDLASEENETLHLVLNGPTGGAAIADGSSLVTLVDDDAARQITINDSATIEGDYRAHFRGPFLVGNYVDFLQISFGPDNILYAATNQGEIRRYDAFSGAFIDTLVPPGRIDSARDIRFRDGFMYVGSESTDEVLRYDLNTRTFVGAFVTAGSGGLDGTHGITFGPDVTNDGVPELYVSGRNSHNVVRYNGATGLPVPGTYVTTGSGGLAWPEGLTFDPTGAVLMVSSAGTNQILKYNALSGAFLGVAASTALSTPIDVKFGPDGLMYVASAGNDRIIRFNAQGTYVDDYVPAGAGGMDYPYRVHFGPDGDVYVTARPGSTVFRFGTESEVILSVSHSTPSSLPLTVNFASADLIPPSAQAGSDYTVTSGTVTFEPGVTSKFIRVPILDDTATESVETFFVNISLNSLNPGAGTIVYGQAIASILDNDPFTKFYVVNDASTDQTYEYGATGASVENYALSIGNTAPRGAASTTLGTTVWVVDANKSVYVYDTKGALQGTSWAAGGLQSSAQLEGIATNGTDVWLVDRTADKVYRYTNAASRTSGSQNAASSFSLNSGNTNPMDIVTDGNYLWVIDDSSTDKVFKYTVAGTFVGSWRISTSGAKSPTGITLDPSNPSHVWIVDSGTDKVYQYDNAVGLTSGSKSANSNWALAAGNTNPQGIADPPPPSVGLSAAPASIVSNTEFMQAPVVLLGLLSTERAAQSPRVLPVTASVDEYMRQLASLLPVAFTFVSKDPSTTLPSRIRFAEDQSIDLALSDDELNDSMHAIANDLFESTLR